MEPYIKKEVTVDGQTYKYVSRRDETRGGGGKPDGWDVYHYILLPNGEWFDLDWASYETPTDEQLEKYIRLGMPDRNFFNTNGPIDGKMVMSAPDRKLVESPFKFLSMLINETKKNDQI